MPERAEPEGTLLAFDFGFRRIGVAVGQTTTRTANPLLTLGPAKEPDWRRIGDLVEEWRPCALVVGLPLDEAGEETTMSAAARRFGDELAGRFGLPVFHVDERLTSRQAQAQFAEQRADGRARRKDAGNLDAIAAKIILENWLQSRPESGADRPEPDRMEPEDDPAT
ncbi:MAG: Holliday junction resolvase RuvX [Xanthomonadales bacterium]|nr:Holliday junction resolvase RuvX [Xanthomonadales bacterium]NIQ97308.1 Holliday junction resolvase RuvX [Desulfuromonadales bacterium]NIX12159.1 Holliday junction resolvase RuvX [Xanthomonadales bacterium]